jgi:hypothetical protein
MDFVQRFADSLRARARDPLLGTSSEARQLERVADELEAEWSAHQNERLTGVKAAEESGFTPQAIGRWRREGLISDRRKDLPRKPGHGVTKPGPSKHETPSIADRVLRGRKVG